MVEIALDNDLRPPVRRETTRKPSCKLRRDDPIRPADIMLLRNVPQGCDLVRGILRRRQRWHVVVARPVVVIQVSRNGNQQGDIRPPLPRRHCRRNSRPGSGEWLRSGASRHRRRGWSTRRPRGKTFLRSNSIQRMLNRGVPPTGRAGRDRRRYRSVEPARGVTRADRQALDLGWGAVRPARPPWRRRRWSAGA